MASPSPLANCVVAAVFLMTAPCVVFAQGPYVPDGSLTWHGITLYGVIDIGLQYDTHAAPVSDYLAAGTAEVIQKNSNQALFGVVPNNMGFSRVGLKGDEPLFAGWSGVFELTTVFSPLSGEISDCLKSLAVNNGRPLTSQTSGVDCPIAGQAFGRDAYAGVRSDTYGAFTFGRQRSILGDGIFLYDPAPSFAFSLIGFSGIPGGGGDPEDLFLDSSLKYSAKYGPVHAGAVYQFGNTGGSENYAVQLQMGAEAAGASIDAFFARKKDAIFAASLTAKQVASLAATGDLATNSLAATVSDNTAYAVMASYTFGKAKIFAGYETIEYENPSHPLEPGYDTLGGYTLAFVNNAAYVDHRMLQVFWSGLKYSITSDLNISAAYYGWRQNSYATGANAGCTTDQSPGCSGSLNAWSLSTDWRISKRFDIYAGSMRTSVSDGLSSGYLNTSNVATTAGIRFTF
jgi:predicted porin